MLNECADKENILVLWGIGDHGGGPSRVDLNEITEFMKEHTDAKNSADLFALLGQPAALSVKTIQNNYGLDNEKAKILFENMWIYTYGIGTLCATGVCSFTEEDASRLLTEQFKAQMLMMTSKN